MYTHTEFVLLWYFDPILSPKNHTFSTPMPLLPLNPNSYPALVPIQLLAPGTSLPLAQPWKIAAPAARRRRVVISWPCMQFHHFPIDNLSTLSNGRINRPIPHLIVVY